MRNLLLVRYGEIFLKGQNRPLFMRALVKRIKYAVKDLGATVLLHDGRILVSDFDDLDECIRRVTKVFGVHSVCPAVEMPKDDFDALCNQAVAMMADLSGTFRVTARRSDKNYFMDSPAIAAVAAALPDGTLLLSGGIDSPVAGWMIAKRGVHINAVHFHSYPYTSDRAKEKVLDLARILSESCCGIRVHIVPFTKIQMEIHEKCPEEYTTLIMRRFMMRIAEKVARQENSEALITGESVGQVASQTMTALGTTDMVVDMPVFRPLIGFDKEEIIAVSEKIGTFETSSLPYEDCCTVFTPRHPATHPKMEKILEGESKLDIDGLIDEAMAGIEIVCC